MTKRIFRSIFSVSAVILVISIGLIMGLLYGHFGDQLEKELKPECVKCGDFTVESGHRMTAELFQENPNLDTVICATDTMAAGAVRYLREHGKKVPEDILVAGHGDSEIARVITPPIPTVHFSYEKSGEMAVEMLIEMMGQGETAVREVKLGYSLINI